MADIRKSQSMLFGGVNEYTLTESYVASAGIKVDKAYQVGLDIGYAMGATETANSIDIKIEFSNENTQEEPTVWYQQVSTAVASGESTISLHSYTFTATVSAGTFDRFHVSLPLDATWFRVSVKENGIITNGGILTMSVAISEESQ